MKAKTHLEENVEYLVRGSDGKIKKVFQTWNWVSKLIKTNRLSPNHPKIPVILGYWANQMAVPNAIVNGGAAAVAGLINGTAGGTAFRWIAVGTGTTGVAVTDVILEHETTSAGLNRGTATNTLQTTDVTGDTAQSVLSFTVTAAVAVTESGIFNASPAGTMLARQTFSAINVANGDTLQITWKIDVD